MSHLLITLRCCYDYVTEKPLRLSRSDSYGIGRILRIIPLWNYDQIGSPWIPSSPFKNFDQIGGPWIPACRLKILTDSAVRGSWYPFFGNRTDSAVRRSLHLPGSLLSPLKFWTDSAVHGSLFSPFKIWTKSTVRGSLHPPWKIPTKSAVRVLSPLKIWTDSAVRGSLYPPLIIKTRSAVRGSHYTPLKIRPKRRSVGPAFSIKILDRFGSQWISAFPS